MRLVILLVLLVSGCLAAPSPNAGTAQVGADDWSVRALPFGEGHDHSDAAHHAGLTTPNFQIVGYDPLLSPDYGGTTPGGYLCGDAKAVAGGRQLAVVESRSDVGFTIVDVTDAAHPKWLGELVMRRTHVYDVAMAPDGKHVVAVTSGVDSPDNGVVLGAAVPRLEWRGACGTKTLGAADPIPRPPSTLLIDISDPADPRIIDEWPIAGYGHSVIATDISGTTFIVTANTATSDTDTFDVFGLMTTPLGVRLDHLSTVKPDERLPESPGLGGHSEALLQVHPITKKPLLYIQSRETIHTYDFSDPRSPKALGSWTDLRTSRAGYSGNQHSLFALSDVRDGKHYVIVGPEYGGHPTGHPSGIVWVLDDTDPTKLHEVAAWTLPHEAQWSGEYMFSTHYLAAWNDTLFVSMYHGGVWAIDISDLGDGASLKLLPSVGVFEPTNVSPKPPTHPTRWTPTVEEVRPLPDGTLITFDSNSGLYAFRYDESKPMPAPTPWPIEPLR
ncbi:MAG: hypothetical protein WDA16_05010 [Candidatus Thermoplasmatota archaeon]